MPDARLDAPNAFKFSTTAPALQRSGDAAPTLTSRVSRIYALFQPGSDEELEALDDALNRIEAADDGELRGRRRQRPGQGANPRDRLHPGLALPRR